MFHKAGMLAADGRCKTLDASADGYVRGEAIGALLLRAVQQGSSAASALALFCSSAVNQDGRSSSLTAPNGPSQQEVMRAALGIAGLSATDVTALGMHGTGTALGDPIEVGAAAAVLNSGSRPAPLVLMASKSWIGHAEPAAGLVGLTHAQLAVTQARKLPILHLGGTNQYVTALMERQPGAWSVPRQPAVLGSMAAAGPEASAARLVSGVSAFAFQGTNAHALLSAAPFAAGLVAPTSAATVWQQQRFWVAPAAHR